VSIFVEVNITLSSPPTLIEGLYLAISEQPKTAKLTHPSTKLVTTVPEKIPRERLMIPSFGWYACPKRIKPFSFQNKS